MNPYPTPTDPNAMTNASPYPPPTAPYGMPNASSLPPPSAPPADPGVQPLPPQSSYSPPPPQPPAYNAAQGPTKPDKAATASAEGTNAQKPSQPVYHPPPPSNLGHKPVVLTCSQCSHRGPSTVTSDNCTAVNWICTLAFCLCCFFCIPATAKHTHTCSNCGGYLGSNNIF